MSNQKDHDAKHRRNDNLLKNLPAEVLLKARSTLVSLGGALKPRHEQQQQSKTPKPESKNKKSYDRLKSCRSEPEFSEIRSSKHRSRIDDVVPREYRTGPRQRPLSVGAAKRYNDDISFHGASFSREMSPLRRQFDSSDEVCVQSRLVIPVTERLQNLDVHMQDINERPRKKLSFREPEIVSNGSGTLGRSNKLMGVNSLTRRPNKISLRSDIHSSLDGLDSDLESQAMRIVRTVGQAFEVCHKMQTNTPEQPAPSTSSAVDDPTAAERLSEVKAAKEPASDCGGSESGAVSTTKVVVEEASHVGSGKEPVRPKHLDILPPPPRKEGKRTQQQTSVPSINLPDLPECVTKVEISSAPEDDTSTPLSAQHQLKLLRERLDQQAQQTQAAVAQLLLLRDQLAAEQAARCEAQARTHQLLVHNKELLEHIAALVAHLQEREKGNARPISAQQLTLLPQKSDAARDANKTENFINNNGNQQQLDNDALLNFLAQNSKPTQNQNIENNNVHLSTFNLSSIVPDGNANGSAPCFTGMTNEQIQNYLISKFQNMTFANGHVDKTANNNQHFFQNNNAFPNIPPLTNHFSNSDLASLLNHQLYKDTSGSSDEAGALAQAMSVGQSQNSLYSNSQPTTSKDSSPDAFSSDEGQPFIMPLSHNATLAATGNDGRVRLIVPVSPSESTSDVLEAQKNTQNPSVSLKVPGDLSPAAPITRTTSEKVPNRSELMTALRAQWTRHTTK